MLVGPLRQNAYVVDDLDKAMRYWIEAFNVGPFFKLPRTTFSECLYKGQSTNPTLAIALANWGELQIELIQPLDKEPSYYSDFLYRHGPGMQHMAVWAEDFDSACRIFERHHSRPLMKSTLSHGIRANIYDAAPFFGAALEVMEYTPAARERMGLVRAAAIDWDGNDPIRHIIRSEAPDARGF